MNPTTLINEVREYINKGKLARAFEVLISWLEQAPKPISAWADIVRNLSSQYADLEAKEIRNTISHDDASVASSQIKESLLNVLTSIGKGQGPVEKVIKEATASKIPWLPIGVVLALVLATASFFMLRKDHGPIINPPDIISDTTLDNGIKKSKCPSFDKESAFNIMVLPYQPLGGKPQRVGSALRIRLSEMMEEYKISGDVLSKDIDVNGNNYPVSSKEAIKLGKPCKAQLIIWGSTEQKGDDLITITNFRFLDSDIISSAGIELNPSAEIDTISSISSIATSQELTEEIEASIKLILGLVAFENGNFAVCSEIFEEVLPEKGGASSRPTWGLLQAEGRIKNGNTEGAVAIYNEILEKNPEHASTRLSRANVYVRTNDLYQANADLEQLEKSADMEVETKNIRKEYRVKHKAEVVRKTTAEEQLKMNPKDTSALRIQAQAARNLGQFEVANIAASSLLKYDPQNKIAITTLMEIKPMVKDTASVGRRLENAQLYYNASQLRNFNVREIQNNN